MDTGSLEPLSERPRTSSRALDRPLRRPRRRRRFRRQHHGRARASAACACWSSTGASTSPATPTTSPTTPACWSTATAPTSSTPTAEGRRVSVAVHRVAAVRAPGAGGGRRAARADADQPDHGQPAVRPRPGRRAEVEAYLAERAEPVGADRPPRTRSSQGRARPLREAVSAATRASSGRSTRAELDASVCARSRSAPTTTTATSPTGSRRCRPTATRAMFERMLDHRGIEVRARRRLRRCPRRGPRQTARLHRPDRRVLRPSFGALPYRSLEFQHGDERDPGRRHIPAGRPRSTIPSEATPTRA